MTSEDEFAAWVARAVLQSQGEEVQVLVLDDLVSQASIGGDLDSAVSRSLHSQRRSGDFGMAIVGSLLIPVLLEASKQLWATYLKKLADKTADKLAETTVTGMKAVARRLWSGSQRQEVTEELVKLVRIAGERQGLEPAQIHGLLTAIRKKEFVDEFRTE